MDQRHFNTTGCPASPEYQDVIDFAARNTFNPELLGDINELKNKNNCKIHSPSDGVDLALHVLQELDPSINGYRDTIAPIGVARAGIGSALELQNGKLNLSKVYPGGPAFAGGLKSGDKITSIDGKPIDQSSEMLDLHKRMLSEKFKSDGSIGIGMTRQEKGPVTISQIEPKSAAEAAGLMDGDKIVAINSRAITEKDSLHDLNKKLEGRDGSVVNLLIERNDERVGLNLVRRKDGYPAAALTVERDGKTFETTVPRRQIQLDSVTAKYGNDELAVGGQKLPPDTTYIKVDNFYDQGTSNQIWKALHKQSEENSASANSVILDLRDNRGGLIDDTVLSASLFIKQGDVYKHNSRVTSDPSNPKFELDTVSLNDKTVSSSRTSGGKLVSDGKSPQSAHPRLSLENGTKQLIVLVNDQTSGSGEMLAESLKVNAGATLVGTETKGYGVTQLAHKVKSDTMLTITTGHLLSPSGRWFGNGRDIRNGVAPHVRVENSPNIDHGSNDDEQVKAAIKLITDKNK